MSAIKTEYNRKAGSGGDCYESAGMVYFGLKKSGHLKWGYAPDVPKCLLCHGVVINQRDGKPMGHAWIEWNNSIYEVANGRDLRIGRKKYYELGKIKESTVHRYTHDEAREKIGKHGHWGPWDFDPPR